MRFTPRLLACFRVPATSPRVPDFARTADTPVVQRWPHRRLVIIRRDTELSAYDLDRLIAGDHSPAASFPAPWPRRAGGLDAVSPALDLAVFSGQHALHAVDPAGGLRWRVRHACWAPTCLSYHDSYEEYADRKDHRYPDQGSCWISADASKVWAHVRTALPDDVEVKLDEEWLVLDAVDGRIRGRASTDTAAAGSHHIPHPDPDQMGLSVGEGQDGVPLRWGRWDGTRLTVTGIGDDDRCLIDVSPTGRLLLTVAHQRNDLAIHRLPEGAVTHRVPAPGEPADAWDFESGFIDEHTAMGSTGDARNPQRWLIDTSHGNVLGEVTYPSAVLECPKPLGDGTWPTCGDDRLINWNANHLRRRQEGLNPCPRSKRMCIADVEASRTVSVTSQGAG